MRYIVDLNKDSRWGINTIGTKAFNLQKLMILKAKVPPCSVVTVDAFRDSSENRVSEPLLKELSYEISKLKSPIITRSSTLLEDTAQSSKAGVFATVPDVNTLSDLKKGIEHVWGSSKGADIAVILQEQLKPDIAGVLFTRDPVTGANKKAIEYVEGMGDALVSGIKTPVRVESKDSRFKELVSEGERLESWFGYPLDIEWAKKGNTFYILQARPITALPIPPKEAQPTYSMVLAEQFFSGPSSPLFFSIFKFLFENYYAGETAREVGLDAIPKEPLLIKHKDHMYVNTFPTEYLLEKARGLGDFQQQLKVLPEDIREEFDDSQKKNILGGLGLLLKILFLIMKHPRLRRSKMDKEYIRNIIPQILIGLETLQEHPKTKKQMEIQYQNLIQLSVQHIRSSKWGMAHCIMLSSLMQRFLEKNDIDNPDEKLLILMSGLPNEKTSEGIAELQILARKYKQDRLVNGILNYELEGYERYKEKLMTNSQGCQFIEAFESILFRYGHRRLARDIIEPSWTDEPMVPFNMLRDVILSQDRLEFQALRNRGVLKRKEVKEEISKRIPIYKRRRFKSNSNYLVRYLAFRELQRFYLDMILSQMRSLFIDIGKMMAKEGLIEDKHDVFFCEIGEIRGYLKGKKRDLKYIAAFRKMSFKESSDKPGRFLRNGVDFDTISPVETQHIEGNVIKGEPVSAGTYTGKVKVIENIDNKTAVKPGVVLVTKSIDPGQTQVFTSAGGLILEVGGLLSHGAILAREFGIPAVSNVNNATSLFTDGQEVVVNGTKGEVAVIKNCEQTKIIR